MPDFQWIDERDTGYDVEEYKPEDEAPEGSPERGDCAGEGEEDG